MKRTSIDFSRAALVAACLVGCSGSSDGPRPVLSSIFLFPSPSFIEVGDKLSMTVSAESDQGVEIFDFGPLAFYSSDLSKVVIDSQSGVATAVDTGTVTITAVVVSSPLHFATANITVLPTQSPDVFASDSLTLTPRALLVKASNVNGSGFFEVHIGHVAHHVQITASPWLEGVPRDLGVHADTTIGVRFRSRGLYELRCLIHPSMSATVVIQ